MKRLPQLLTVWNPYLEPQTIQAHVEILRRERRVWWSRLHRGRPLHEAVARRKWKRVAALADEGRELLLFATDFQTLHALRVRRVIFGAHLAAEERAFVPRYYERDEVNPAIWFDVRDIRALAFNPMDTLRYFLEGTGKAGEFSGYDPYAAFWHWYPIVFEGPPAEELFDPAGLPPKARLYADLEETVYPPMIRLAQEELSSRYGAAWGVLEEKSRVFLATSWVVYRHHGNASGFDLSAALSGIARALESELCELLLPAAEQLVELRLGSGTLAVIRGEDAPRHLTLGVAARRLAEFSTVAISARLPALARLCADPDFRKWLADFVALRNQMAHVTPIRPARARAHLQNVFAEGGASPLASLAPVKEELAAALAAEQAS